jgi:hypothetical protein
MSIRTIARPWYTLDSAPAAPFRDAIKPLPGAGDAVQVIREGAVELDSLPIGLGLTLSRAGPAATLLRSSVLLSPAPVRPYFAVCAVEGWRRVPVGHLAAWSGIPFGRLKRRLAPTGLTPASVAAWNLALHAAWLLDVAELPAAAVVSRMRLGRTAALGAILGGRAVRFSGGMVEPGAFALSLERYIAVLRGAFRV